MGIDADRVSVTGWLAASGSLSLITDITSSSTSDPEQSACISMHVRVQIYTL